MQLSPLYLTYNNFYYSNLKNIKKTQTKVQGPLAE